MKKTFEVPGKDFPEARMRFGTEPVPFLKEILKHKTSGELLELGAGEGRNAVFFASQGFSVKAVDLSEEQLSVCKEFAESRGVLVEAEVADLSTWSVDRDYDVFVSTYMLHYLSEEEAHRLLGEMKAHTKPGGIHALCVFLRKGDVFEAASSEKFYPTEGWLEGAYKDWEILGAREVDVPVRTKNEDGTPKRNLTGWILARKPVA